MTNANKSTGGNATNAGNTGNASKQGNSNADSIPTPNRPTTAPSQPSNPRPIAGTAGNATKQGGTPRTGANQQDDQAGGIDSAVTQGYDDRKFGKDASNPRTSNTNTGNTNTDEDSDQDGDENAQQDIDSPTAPSSQQRGGQNSGQTGNQGSKNRAL